MSVFTSVSNDCVSQFLTRFSCGKLISLKGISEGISNSNFNLITTKGKFILTIYEHIDARKLSDILSLQQHLNYSGIVCAAAIKNLQGNLFDSLAGKPASILQKLDGSIHFPITNNLCKQVGKTIAQFHLVAEGYNFNIVNSRGSKWISDISTKLMEHLPDPDQELIHEELDFLSQYSTLALPSGAIHADLFPDNVLVQDDLIVGIIDFDLACVENYLFDICICINAWCSKDNGQLDRFRMRDLLSAYSSVRALSREENLAIPFMLRATALRFWLSRLNDVIFPVDGELTFNKDPDEFKAILLARRQRLSGMQR